MSKVHFLQVGRKKGGTFVTILLRCYPPIFGQASCWQSRKNTTAIEDVVKE